MAATEVGGPSVVLLLLSLALAVPLLGIVVWFVYAERSFVAAIRKGYAERLSENQPSVSLRPWVGLTALPRDEREQWRKAIAEDNAALMKLDEYEKAIRLRRYAIGAVIVWLLGKV